MYYGRFSNGKQFHIFTIFSLQYFFDSAEAEAWMSEQELYMMGEDRAKDEMGANNMLKKHSTLEKTVEDYSETIRSLGERSRTLIEENHPDRYWFRLPISLTN